ncbi:MAG: TPM domain-containing protein [Candidatus Eisenbacteria bacterium]
MLLSLFSSQARAETPAEVPNPRVAGGGWVSDNAGILDDATEQAINTISNDLEHETSAEVAVATVHNSGDMTPKEFATALFKLWGVGKAEHDNGVLILVASDLHRIEVEVGYGCEGVLPDGRVGRILDESVIPHYRQGDWDAGTLGAVMDIATVLRRPDSAAAAAPRSSRRSQGLGWALIFLGGLGAVTGAGFGLRDLRWRRSCSRCGKRMRLLSESEDDAVITSDELLEETLGSVNHMVWRCEPCGLYRTEHRNKAMSGFTNCPQCGRRTVEHWYTTIVAATTEHAGEQRKAQACKRPGCGYQESHVVTIPRREVSSSSSDSSSSWSSSSSSSSSSDSSSFGGGSSGGGGAGRSW